MTNFILYSLGWLVAGLRLFGIFRDSRLGDLVIRDRILLWLVYLTPLGKLVYFHFSGLIGFKFSFLLWSIACVFMFLLWLASKRFRFKTFLISLMFLFFPALSLLLRGDFGDLFFYSEDGQVDSLGARFLSLVFLLMFALAIMDFCQKKGIFPIIRAFVDGIITASFIGVFIFSLVYLGLIGVSDLLPISADTHIVGQVYRFNPGGNVNEFGLIAIYGVFLLRIARPDFTGVKIFAVYALLFFALFFSLTRAAWIAYICSVFCMALFSRQARNFLIFAILGFFAVVALVYQLDEDFSGLVSSRFALVGGASGDERIDKIKEAFFSQDVSIINLIFGFGWATNLYIHSVPLQIIYEIGFAGFLLVSASIAWALWNLAVRAQKGVFAASPLLGCLVAFIVNSAFHHTIYHMQTWLLIGLVVFVAFSPIALRRTAFAELQRTGRVSLQVRGSM